MANLSKLQEFAYNNNFGLTSPLTDDQVRSLAAYWFPEMRFHEKEKFHPIAMGEYFTMIDELFGALPSNAQEAWKVPAFVRASSSTGVVREFLPPAVFIPDGFVFVPGTGNQQVPTPVVRLISEGSSVNEDLDDPDVDSDAIVTHGGSFRCSNQFFGSSTTIEGGNEGSPGDPFLPRAPRITVMASLLNLIELLKYELLVSADNEYPSDGLRGAVEIANSLLEPITASTLPLPFSTLREFLLELIESREPGADEPTPPPGWRLNRKAWNAVIRFAFLEYDFFYAFNDFSRHETALFANEHEGDNEGCCLVFDRTSFTVSPDDLNALLRVIPHSMISSVHEEWQDADDFKFVDPPVSFPPELRARDVAPFTVFIAAGSHATYFTSGPHPLVDFQDHLAYVQDHLLSVILTFPISVPLLILSLIVECFTDTVDITSDDGIRTGPAEFVGGQPTAVGNQLVVMPMSADNNIYLPANEDLLRLRAYAGKWGSQDGAIDHSPTFRAKTARYFRKLISKI